jgi:fructose-1-phosphate kinase PfkB-like protein
VEPALYGELVRELHKMGLTTVLDTEGEPLRLGVRAEPTLVSPNELEAEQLVGHEFNDDEDRAEAVVEMTKLGAREAIMTVDDGCFARFQENGEATVVRVRVPEQEARSPIGSGDAFLAGYLAYRYMGKEPVETLRYAVACGAESTQHFGAGVIDPGRVGRLLDEVEVERLEVGAQVS